MADFDNKLHDYYASIFDKMDLEGWDQVNDKDGFKIWRKKKAGSGLYEYRAHGVMQGIEPTLFFRFNQDLEYRKKWDEHVSELVKHDGDVVYWVVKFPFPFSNREYVFKYFPAAIEEKGVWIISARSIEDERFKHTKSKLVRVDQYTSVMVLRANGEKDMELFLDYFDDPKMDSIPSWLQNWVLSKAVPSFIKKLQQACKEYPEWEQKQKK
jgi:hypothetical protein